MSDLNFKHYELTSLTREEILTKAEQLQKTLANKFGESTLQDCVDQVIRAYASYDPNEENVGLYA